MRSFEYFPLLRCLLRFALKMRMLPERVYQLRAKQVDYATEKLEE